jgi:hypothetical protein
VQIGYIRNLGDPETNVLRQPVPENIIIVGEPTVLDYIIYLPTLQKWNGTSELIEVAIIFK